MPLPLQVKTTPRYGRYSKVRAARKESRATSKANYDSTPI
jgi:hypothetical protein